MTTLLTSTPESRASYVGIGVTVLIAMLSLGLSAFAAYSHNDKDISNRVTTVETKQNDDRETMKRIEHKLDSFIEYETGVKP